MSLRTPAHNQRIGVLQELAKRARRLDDGSFERDPYGLAYFLESLADSLADADLAAFPVADRPLMLAEAISVEGRTYILGVHRVEGRLTPVYAEAVSEFRPL